MSIDSEMPLPPDSSSSGASLVDGASYAQLVDIGAEGGVPCSVPVPYVLNEYALLTLVGGRTKICLI